MRLKLVKLSGRYQRHLTEMMDEWCASGEKIFPRVIGKGDHRDFAHYLEHLETGEAVSESAFFCLDEERDIFVGAVGIRHCPDESLSSDGGRMEDGVRPSERGKGIADCMIGLALEECRKLGLKQVFMVCDRGNEASVRSIIKNGGEAEGGDVTGQRYRIDTKLLFLEDAKNYTEDMPLIERRATRGIICRNGKYAMQLSGDGEYKIPGGGADEGESLMQALCREVAEETGLLVDGRSARYCGEIIEIRRDLFEEDKKYIKHSHVYLCDVLEERVGTNMTESEIRRGFHPVWESLDVILSENRKNIREEWRLRDTKLLELLLEKGVIER